VVLGTIEKLARWACVTISNRATSARTCSDHLATKLMWQRRTYHDCASELEQASDRFREAIVRRQAVDSQENMRELESSSKDGTDLLKIIALSVRPEQDFGLLPSSNTDVGTLVRNADSNEIQSALTGSKIPPVIVPGSKPLGLREALNKIAHMDPRPGKSSFSADRLRHEVVLTGEKSGHKWIAILDIPKLCKAIKSLPDRNIKV
jgi:hypothetical protein